MQQDYPILLFEKIYTLKLPKKTIRQISFLSYCLKKSCIFIGLILSFSSNSVFSQLFCKKIKRLIAIN
jgi:hypothetical protein